jgi:hypothetical protein
MTPFWLPPLLAIVLVGAYLFLGDGRWGSKLLLVGLLLLSFLIGRRGGVPGAMGLVLQAGLSIYVLLWLRIRR